MENEAFPLKEYTHCYKVVGYCDDIKPAITTMNEFVTVDKGVKLFEDLSGCSLHRDPPSNKCKLFPLGRLIGTLTQEDIPFPHLRLSEHLNMLGVVVTAKYAQTRKKEQRQHGDHSQEHNGQMEDGKVHGSNMQTF